MGDIEFGDWMSEADALMWHMERDPVLRSTITTVWVLDQAPDPERFDASIHRAIAEVPRLRQRVVSDANTIAPPKWDPDPLFDPDYHVRSGRIGGDGTLRDLLDHAAPIAQQAFDKDRPLWELHLLDGMQDGRVGVVMKLHHAISDGVGLVKMTGALMERSREPSDDDLAAPPTDDAPASVSRAESIEREAIRHQTEVGLRRAVSGATAMGKGAVGYLRDPVGSSRAAVETTSSIARSLRPVTTPMSPIMNRRSLSTRFDAMQCRIDQLKAAAHAADGTLNDAYVAAMLGGLARYHEHHDAMVDELRMTMPINVRTGDDRGRTAGNVFAPARFAVPLGITDPVERIGAIHALVQRERAEPAYGRIGAISTALFSLRPAVFTRLTGSMLKAIDFVTSNVPGPPFGVYVSGAKIERSIPFGPLSGSAVNLTLYSYDGLAEMGVNADKAAVPDGEVLTDCLEEGIAEVLAVA